MEQTNLKQLHIGIMGVGVLGSALHSYFTRKGTRTLPYDPFKDCGSLQEMNSASVIFICVPTPFQKDGIGFDLSYVGGALKGLIGEKIVVIKSTMLPGTTERLQKEYPQHKFLFNPEFLVEEKAMEDMLHPERQIIGYTEQSKDEAEMVLKLLPKAPYEQVIPATEAEMVKYFGNTFLAIKVIFGNYMYDLCQKLGIDYNIVYQAASADKRIGPSHLDVYHGGYRGYGGKCFPKDIRALLQLADSIGVDLKLHRVAEETNNQLMEDQEIDDPEKLSTKYLNGG